MPLVSVVIPAYNAGPFLGEALDSVFAQGYADLEVIVVDDGSTDNTREVAESYGDRIRYIRQDNAGASAARNRGIREAKGDFVAFLDADDLWVPSKLQKQLELFDQRPELGMVITDCIAFGEWGEYVPPGDKRERLMVGDICQNIFLYSGVGTPSVMVRREVFDKVGMFNENLPLAEDDNMWIRIAADYPVELIDEVLVRVRDHANRSTKGIDRLLDAIQANVQALQKEHGHAWERIAEVYPRKIANLKFAIGTWRLDEGDHKSARQAFREGLQSDPTMHRSRWYLLLTYLPPGLIRTLKGLKRRIFGRRRIYG